MGIRVPLFRRRRHDPVMVQPEFAQGQAEKLVQRLFRAGGPARVGFDDVLRHRTGSASSTVCARTAEVLASQVAGRVCVVDANSSTPSLHQYFQLENREGFSDALVKSISMLEVARQIQGHKLSLVTCGTSSEVSLTMQSG